MMSDAESLGQVPDRVPRCTHCGHRRIFHYEMVAYNKEPGQSREQAVPCSLPSCRCYGYEPASAFDSPARARSAPNLAGRRAMY